MAASTVGVIGLGFGRAHIPAFRANGCEVAQVILDTIATAAARGTWLEVPPA